ncbi:hypothetical protein R3W88_004037 [Solanum pinnatisectum]|uniref:Uncharacterized protein n=1 Tax=Solanum pinnatisectum TaxID=50273 RepID=A0AAV9MTS5_9SOLN|nr:hypothetical protein R3W88_004037 [Solanum pinnatisectum]
MVSHSLIGRILFGSYFIFSGSFKDPRYKEEFTSKFAGLLNISEGFGVAFFVTSFASEQVVGGFLILFDNLNLGVINLGVYLLIATPILFDFLLLLQGFLQNMAFFGVLLIFVEMNTTNGRKMLEWTLDPTQFQNNIPLKSTIQHLQPQNNIPTKSMTQYCRETNSSPQTFLLPVSNICTLHRCQLMPSQEINLSVDLLSQQIHESSSFLAVQLNDPHKLE